MAFRLTEHDQKWMRPSINNSCLRHEVQTNSTLPRRFIIALIVSFHLRNTGMAQQRRVDDPDDQDDLNRELWSSHARPLTIQSFLTLPQRKRSQNARDPPEVELPNGCALRRQGRRLRLGGCLTLSRCLRGSSSFSTRAYYYFPNTKERRKFRLSMSNGAGHQIAAHQFIVSERSRRRPNSFTSAWFRSRKFIALNHSFEIDKGISARWIRRRAGTIDAEHVAVATMALKNAKGEYINGRLGVPTLLREKWRREIDLGYFPYAVKFIAGKLFVTLLGENKLPAFDTH
jgi:hypothetical protein